MSESQVGEGNQRLDWTPEKLATLRVRDGVRLRGEEMTRLEMFSDAAFAFAMTMQVIASERVPGNLEELFDTLKRAPAFAASFTLIMLLWSGHRRWSRRFGLEDGGSVVLSLALVFSILVYIDPLRLMASVLLNWLSGGYLPSLLEIEVATDLTQLFALFGFGYFLLAGLLALLNGRALRLRDRLALDEVELEATRFDQWTWTIGAMTGLASALLATFGPRPLDLLAGFVYWLLPISMPFAAVRHHRRMSRLLEAREPQAPSPAAG